MDLCEELQTWMLQIRTSAQFDLAMRPAGSLFSGAVFGYHDVAIKKQFDGPIKGYVFVKLNTKIDAVSGNEIVTCRDNKILMRVSDDDGDDGHQQDVVLDRILHIVKIVSVDATYIELFSVDPRVSEIVAGFLKDEDDGIREAWRVMPHEGRGRVIDFMHELQKKEGDSNTMEFLYDLSSVLSSSSDTVV